MRGVALTTSEYLLSSLRWGWLVGGMGGGGPSRIFINISRVARAQRAASLPTNPRGPHVETDRGSEKRDGRTSEKERAERERKRERAKAEARVREQRRENGRRDVG